MSMHQFFYMLWLCLAVFLVIILACFDKFLFVFKSFECFLFDQSLLSFVSKIQKVWLALLCFVTCMFCLVPLYKLALCIYERSLFSMHSYHCGKNLDIYVIVVNRSSNLSWIISHWFCWSWDMHRLVPIYLPTLLYFCL